MRPADTSEAGRYVVCEFLRRVVNRKLSAVLGDAGVLAGELKDQVVESGSQIVTNLPQDDADDQRRAWKEERGPMMNAVRRVRVEIETNGLKIILPKGGDVPSQLGKMFLCPIDPLKSAVEWVGRNHAAATA